MSCLNEERIRNINKSISDISNTCQDIKIYFAMLKNLLKTNPNIQSQINSNKPIDDKPIDDKPNDDKPNNDKPIDDKPIDDKPNDDKPVNNIIQVNHLMMIIDDKLKNINNDIYLLELSKLKVLRKSVSGKLTELDPYKLEPKNNLLDSLNLETRNFRFKSSELDIPTQMLFSDIITPKRNSKLFEKTSQDLDLVNLNINSIHFNPTFLDHSSSSDRKILTDLAFEIISSYVDLLSINIDPKKLRLYIELTSTFYNIHPYHNLIHAVSVLQFAYLLLNHYDTLPTKVGSFFLLLD